MSLDRHRHDWEQLAEYDALWAVLTDPSKRGRRWDPAAFFATGETEVAEVLAATERLGLPRQRRAALDFGCGAGRLTRALAARFERAVGIDIAVGMVETARRLNADVSNADFRVNDAAHLRQFDDGEFDLVYTSLVLQHVPGRELIEGYLRELVRVTAPGGALVASLPDRIRWPYRLALTRRGYALLRRVGVPERTLLERTPLTPMRMTAVPEERVRAVLAAAGAEVVAADVSEDAGVRSIRYVAARG